MLADQSSASEQEQSIQQAKTFGRKTRSSKNLENKGIQTRLTKTTQKQRAFIRSDTKAKKLSHGKAINSGRKRSKKSDTACPDDDEPARIEKKLKPSRSRKTIATQSQSPPLKTAATTEILNTLQAEPHSPDLTKLSRKKAKIRAEAQQLEGEHKAAVTKRKVGGILPAQQSTPNEHATSAMNGDAKAFEKREPCGQEAEPRQTRSRARAFESKPQSDTQATTAEDMPAAPVQNAVEHLSESIACDRSKHKDPKKKTKRKKKDSPASTELPEPSIGVKKQSCRRAGESQPEKPRNEALPENEEATDCVLNNEKDAKSRLSTDICNDDLPCAHAMSAPQSASKKRRVDVSPNLAVQRRSKRRDGNKRNEDKDHEAQQILKTK